MSEFITPKERAIIVCDYLFSTTNNKRGDRLVLMGGDVDLGAWDRSSVISIITKCIESAVAAERQRCADLAESVEYEAPMKWVFRIIKEKIVETIKENPPSDYSMMGDPF